MAGTIRKNIKRPDKKILERFKKIPTTILSDSMNRMNCMHAEIKPVIDNVKIVGPAVTVQCISGSNIMNHQAIYLAKPGDVIVIDARGDKNTAVWGFVQTYACMQRKIGGVVIDGSIRDVLEIRENRYPVFCSGISPAGPHKGWPDNVNVSISCGGATVNPGDVVVGDDDGVTVVPLRQANKVLIDSEKRLRAEKKWFKGIKEGKTSLNVIGLDKKIADMDIIYED